MADIKQQWYDARAEILSKLDILLEYEAMGVELVNRKPNGKGWVPCRSVSRADKNPSAGVNIGDGVLRGRYKDFGGTQKTKSFFDFALEYGKFGGDWKQVILHFARKTSTKLPNQLEETTADKLDLFELTTGVYFQYVNGKQGITIEGMKRFGVLGARWPRKLSPEKTNTLIVAPQYGTGLLDLDPVGYHGGAMNPHAMVRIFQGKENPDKLSKTVQLGDYGLMNVAGLAKLPNAEVVVLLEGFTDGLCGESICPDDAKEVPLSLGGASYHLRNEHIQHFLGKEVWICFDVGDADDAGQIAAKVNATFLVQAGIQVRRIELPQPPGGGKMDFRAWINQGHTWAEFCEYARTFPFVTVEDVEAQLTPHAALLLKLGITVVGEYEGSQKIEVYSDFSKKAQTIYDIDKFSFTKLVQLVGYPKVEEHVHDGKEPVPGKSMLKDVKNAIASEASGKQFNLHERIGAGVWMVDNKPIIVGNRGYSVLETTTKLVEHHTPFYKGRIVDIGADSPKWFDHGELCRLMLQAQSNEWCCRTFMEAEKVFARWNWKYGPTPAIMTSLVACSWIQTLWDWRPGIAITGGTGTGKSTLIDDVLKNGFFGELGMYVQKPSESAIRQHMRHHAKVLMLDEFEHDQNRPAVLKLLRMSGRGGEVYKGTIDQKGVKYRLRHLVWMAAIELGHRDAAELNRYIICDLLEIPEHSRGSINRVMPSQQSLRELGQKLMVIGLRHYRTAQTLANVMKEQQFPEVPGRLLDSFAVACGMISAIHGHDEATALGFLGNTLEQWDFGGQQQTDEMRLMEEILTAEVFLDHGKRLTVNQMLQRPNEPGITEALCRVGLKRFYQRSKAKHEGDLGPDCLFVCHEAVRAKMLGRSSYANQQIETYLLRLKGATRSKQRLMGSYTVSGIAVPIETLNKIFVPSPDDAASEDSEGGESFQVGDDGVAPFT